MAEQPQKRTYPTTPDGRYFVVRGRLWRKSNPHLPSDLRDELVSQLMNVRRRMKRSLPEYKRQAARAEVDEVKQRLGERGDAWWTDGAPDYNRKLVKNTPYSTWFAQLSI